MKFQEKVWKLMEKIPKGKVTTYKIIAKKLNCRAYRAVGNACHNNPYFPRVPCHRVINSNGDIGGFASGTEKKIKLLKKDGIKIKDGKVLNLEKVIHHF